MTNCLEENKLFTTKTNKLVKYSFALYLSLLNKNIPYMNRYRAEAFKRIPIKK